MTDLSALVVSGDPELLRVAHAALAAGEARVIGKASLAAALDVLREAPVDMAVVDARAEGTLALVHHVRAFAEAVGTGAASTAIVVAVDPSDAAVMRAALDLGADALVTTPVHGDALLEALARLRAERASVRAVAEESARAERAEAVTRRMRRLIEAASDGENEAVESALDALAEVAPGIRARFMRAGADDPVTAVSGDTERLPIGDVGREVGTLVLSGGDAVERGTALELAGALSSLLALRARFVGPGPRGPGPSRVLDRALFDDILTREIDKAARHGRPLALLALDPGFAPDEGLTAHLRASDIVGRGGADVFVLLPETHAVGATQLRLRIGRRPAGIATLRDGTTRDALVRASRARRELMRTSPLGAPALTLQTSMGLAATVDRLLGQPLHDAGALTTYPLVLGAAAASSLITHACLEASRIAPALVHVTSGTAAAAVASATALGASLEVTEHAAATPDAFGVALIGELGTWACAGRLEAGGGEARVSALHGADPLLVELLVRAMEPS